MLHNLVLNPSSTEFWSLFHFGFATLCCSLKLPHAKVFFSFQAAGTRKSCSGGILWKKCWISGTISIFKLKALHQVVMVLFRELLCCWLWIEIGNLGTEKLVLVDQLLLNFFYCDFVDQLKFSYAKVLSFFFSLSSNWTIMHLRLLVKDALDIIHHHCNVKIERLHQLCCDFFFAATGFQCCWMRNGLGNVASWNLT